MKVNHVEKDHMHVQFFKLSISIVQLIFYRSVRCLISENIVLQWIPNYIL